MRWGLVCVVSVLIVAGACSSADQSIGSASADAEPDGVTANAGDGSDSDDTDPAADNSDESAESENTGSDESDSELAASDDSGPEAFEPSEPRFDPLPMPPNLDQAEDVFASLLGPTDDFVTQVRRVAPDYRQLPTPPGANLHLVKISRTMPAEGFDPQDTTTVLLTSTEDPDTLATSMEETILADNPGWERDLRPNFRSSARHLVSFDLPDLESPEGAAGLVPDLRLEIDHAGSGSEVRITVTRYGSPPWVVDLYTAWQDELPIPVGSVLSGASIGVAIDVGGTDATMDYRANHLASTTELVDYRSEYLALLADRGLTIENEEVVEDGKSRFAVSGHDRFSELRIDACCTDHPFFKSTQLTLWATSDLWQPSSSTARPASRCRSGTHTPGPARKSRGSAGRTHQSRCVGSPVPRTCRGGPSGLTICRRSRR